MFLIDFRMQKYTGGIISWIGIILTVTPVKYKSYTIVQVQIQQSSVHSIMIIQKHIDTYYFKYKLFILIKI